MKTDGRVRYTRMVIRNSLLQLLTEKPIRKVTVKEICALAEINRATFYTHYRDPFDLLEQIENELFEDVTSPGIFDHRDPEQFTREVFTRIARNTDLCRVLFSENGDKLFLRRILDASREKMIAEWQRQYPQATRQQAGLAYAFVIGGSVAVIEEWVSTGMKDMPTNLGEAAQAFLDTWFGASPHP